MFKLLILDIDGVLTDGTKIYDAEHNVIAKRYNDKDFTAIKRFKEKGIKVCFLTGDRRINEGMAQKRKIDFYCSRRSDGTIIKSSFIPIFEVKYSILKNTMAYIGDDIPDLEIIDKLVYSYCPADAPKRVRQHVRYVLTKKGGEGVVAELYDVLYE